ncbi:histidine kinase [Phytomonospora sp. NPDC050363]|uniref:sensor histidine kinase n=1 Tax=Phytomonospora sp. NPDC050363 TaxID=3155642 RepID=UPI0033CDACC2
MSGRRGVRDWVVDSTAFALAVLAGLVLSGLRIEAGPMPEPPWLYNLDQVVGALGCGALWLRRRWPVQLAVALIAVSAVSELVAGAMLIALFTVAVHRPPRTTLALFGLGLLAGGAYTFVRPDPETGLAMSLILSFAMQSTAVGWGLFVSHRRKLVESLRERAARAESESRMRAEQAQRDTRDTIAREIHDVLGHRLSLLSVHAGALEFRPDAPAADVVRAAGVIRENAHLALQDLREVIGVLRAPVGELPQPGVADVERLVGESVRAGTPVDLTVSLDREPPEQAGRTAYRIVQEALTNARKHAPGEPVRVALTGRAGAGLTVEVRNRVTSAAGGQGGQGLIGLAERVTLAEGTLEHGPEAGEWRLSASLPWPA